jgi:hypothetical protein
MGGQGVKVEEHPRVPLCRAHHREVHEGGFSLKIHGDIARTYQGETCVSERAMVVKDDVDDMHYWSDERLSREWEEAEEDALESLRRQCHAAWGFYQRYRWAEKWYERAAEILTENTGKYTHWRRVYERVNLWLAFQGHWEDISYLGQNLAITVAEDTVPADALEIALSARDSGHTSGGAKALVKARDLDAAREPPLKHDCPRLCPECGAQVGCGYRHKIQEAS